MFDKIKPYRKAIVAAAVAGLTMIKPYRKAIVAAAVAGLAMLLKADTDDVITRAEWIEIMLAVVAGGGVTWAVPNTSKPVAGRGPREFHMEPTLKPEEY